MTTPSDLSEPTSTLESTNRSSVPPHVRRDDTDGQAYRNLSAALKNALTLVHDARRTLRSLDTNSVRASGGGGGPYAQAHDNPRIDLYLAHAGTDLSAALAILSTSTSHRSPH